MELRYSYELRDDSRVAKSMGRDMNISFKDAVVVCDRIRGMMLSDAISTLRSTQLLKEPIVYNKFRKGVGHRKGSSPGKYPVKPASSILKVLMSLESNAEYKGLDTERLKIVHVQAKEGVSRKRRKPKGRWRMWSADLVHVEVVAEEI
ncbi:MAG: 50S ribosomal protein L22 [Candidatus Altiarchaeota archaeon]|nr:50S ribosomal protein L22 [Candidatus Altiarchaeota archaeon]